MDQADAIGEALNVWVPIGFGAIFALAGGIMFAQIERTARSASSWAVTRGVIRRSEIRFQHNPSNTTGGCWVPVIEYDFEVAGELRHGDRIAPAGDMGLSIKSIVEAKIAPYDVNDVVEVRYDPKDPARCCLEVTRDGVPVALGLLAVGLTFAGYHAAKHFL
ncbi:MAG: DUF3592 domain-containing protein [Phycisphaeraceae bacterium]|nr:MAG: DUF3592 domain-containing protein [Phycisphaeraceae bacterium]